jgi:hypothetical protein
MNSAIEGIITDGELWNLYLAAMENFACSSGLQRPYGHVIVTVFRKNLSQSSTLKTEACILIDFTIIAFKFIY